MPYDFDANTGMEYGDRPEKKKEITVDKSISPKRKFSDIVKENRVGTFSMNDVTLRRSPDEFTLVMPFFLIIRCEHMYARPGFEYTAYSELFDKASENEMTPNYDVIGEVYRNADGTVYLTDIEARKT